MNVRRLEQVAHAAKKLVDLFLPAKFTSAKDTNLFLQHILALDANKEKKSNKEDTFHFSPLSSNIKYLVSFQQSRSEP